MCATNYAAVVGFTFKLYCRYASKGQLREDHRFWAKVTLMERDSFSADDVLTVLRRDNRNRSPRLSFLLVSPDVDDGFGDDYLELYFIIEHNCVKNYRYGSRKKVLDLGDNYRVDAPMKIKDLRTIYLP
ncbi:hypothetical protein Aduo_010920 [Ancylostoma duodenale]